MYLDTLKSVPSYETLFNGVVAVDLSPLAGQLPAATPQFNRISVNLGAGQKGFNLSSDVSSTDAVC